MSTLLKLILILSLLLNLVAMWAYFHFVKYGGNPLGELSRMVTGKSHQPVKSLSYAEQNKLLIERDSADGPDSLRVVFFGASITRRWDLERAFPKVHMVNRGVGGQLVPGMLSRFRRDVINLKPKAVVLKFCSINIRPHVPPAVLQDGMTMMVEMARAAGIMPIVSTIIPSGKPEAHIGDFNVAQHLASFNDWVRGYADDHNLQLIDFAAAIADDDGFLPKDCSVDPVHVNEKGYLILSAAARELIYQTVDVNSP